jgi:hypothetical protein
MARSQRRDGGGADSSKGTPRIAIDVQKTHIQVNLEGKLKTFSGPKQTQNLLKLLAREAGPKTSAAIYLAIEVFREKNSNDGIAETTSSRT